MDEGAGACAEAGDSGVLLIFVSSNASPLLLGCV